MFPFEIYGEKLFRGVFRRKSLRIKSICFVAEYYPTEDETLLVFFKQLVHAIADQQIKCSVLAPQSIAKTFLGKETRRAFHWTDRTAKGSKIEIYQPHFLSFSNLRLFGIGITNFFRELSVRRTYRKCGIKPDVLYAHFWHMGIACAPIGSKNSLPVFVASGESTITVHKLYRERVLRSRLDRIDGVICASTKSLKESEQLHLATKEKMAVIPNAIDRNIFFQRDKKRIREELGISSEDFVVVFTGAFIERKGSIRLSRALEKVPGAKAIFIGSGEQRPSGENILFCGRLPHAEVARYLNAADVFALPTLAEGCCNAIIEAMACGLPVISSDLSFNDDILDEQNSIRIDPNNIDAIADAIRFLKDNPQKREKMSEASLLKAQELDIESRARRIVEFMESKIGES